MVKDKTPSMTKALKRLEAFLKENGLDPTINWAKDPIHGKTYTKLINKVNLERDKLTLVYPTRDLKNEVKLTKLRTMKKEKKAAEKEAKAKEKKLVKKTEKETKGKEAKKGNKPTKYDYPLVDGREMTAEEKKKYRMEQRKLAKGGEEKPKKEKEEKKPKKEKKETQKVEKNKKPSKAKKDKKAKKEED